ncbi:preprotein translocase subunit SecE [Mycoplasma sp. 1018B]|uniref:preprotein translocase subunit SecE n=1 Tax=Mycoplasma sp. 1018B TaxID=2967302 RepID=UPI00211C0FB7|nr:preprotein translocase subunit SecE [Mycoplasma sp. 1018B]UUM19329.1 preprotein translocase subunit SecE [Mycoplasma sp. 1018B]
MKNSLKNASKKEKKYFFRKWIKEIKRVRWPSKKTNWTSFLQVIIFSSLFVAFVVIVATVLTLIWNAVGFN